MNMAVVTAGTKKNNTINGRYKLNTHQFIPRQMSTL